MLAALIVVAVIAILVLLVLSAAIKVLREYERGVIFRLGRLLGKPKGPGSSSSFRSSTAWSRSTSGRSR